MASRASATLDRPPMASVLLHKKLTALSTAPAGLLARKTGQRPSGGALRLPALLMTGRRAGGIVGRGPCSRSGATLAGRRPPNGPGGLDVPTGCRTSFLKAVLSDDVLDGSLDGPVLIPTGHLVLVQNPALVVHEHAFDRVRVWIILAIVSCFHPVHVQKIPLWIEL